MRPPVSSDMPSASGSPNSELSAYPPIPWGHFLAPVQGLTRYFLADASTNLLVNSFPDRTELGAEREEERCSDICHGTLVERMSEQFWIRELRERLVHDQKVARRFLDHLMTAGFVPRRSQDIWRIILAAPRKWPRTS